jgi:hypothetical protein
VVVRRGHLLDRLATETLAEGRIKVLMRRGGRFSRFLHELLQLPFRGFHLL